MDIELRHLRSFVAVAEELNFTRAAARLFIAQQALSSQIRQLEDRVGATLLIRTTRHVELTAAGHELYGRAAALLTGAADAVAATRSAAAAGTSLTIGFVAAVDHPMVRHALERFDATRVDVELRVRFGDLLDPTGGLRDREVDAAFVYGPFDDRGLARTPLFEVPMGVACSADHPFAASDAVSLEDLVAETTFDFPSPDPAWRAWWSAAAYRDGRAPSVTAQYRTLEGLLAALRAGLGVSLATESLVRASAGGVVWRPLIGHPPLQHSIAIRADDEREPVLAFVACVADAWSEPERPVAERSGLVDSTEASSHPHADRAHPETGQRQRAASGGRKGRPVRRGLTENGH